MNRGKLAKVVKSQAYAGMAAEEIAADLAQQITRPRNSVSVRDLFLALVRNGDYPRLVAAQGSTDPNVQGAAITAMSLQETMAFVPEVEFNHPATQQFLSVLANAGVISAQTMQEIQALATETVSKAEATYGFHRPPSVEEIRFVMGV